MHTDLLICKCGDAGSWYTDCVCFIEEGSGSVRKCKKDYEVKKLIRKGEGYI